MIFDGSRQESRNDLIRHGEEGSDRSTCSSLAQVIPSPDLAHTVTALCCTQHKLLCMYAIPTSTKA